MKDIGEPPVLRRQVQLFSIRSVHLLHRPCEDDSSVSKFLSAKQILNEFGVDPVHGHIINGHVPVRQKDGENPVKADGKLYVIDGGLSKAYQAKTGIAGYTLIFNSHYLALAQHHDYISHPLSKPESDDMPTLQITQKMDKRILVSDTDAGKKLSQRIEELRLLVKAYENGSFVERAIAAYPKTIPSLHMETMEIVR